MVNLGIDDFESGAFQKGGYGFLIKKIKMLMALYRPKGRNKVQTYACRR
jgi:hypothetical protein